MTITIQNITSANKTELDLFLNENKDHFLYHTLEWKNFIESSFNCKYQIIAAIQKNSNEKIKTTKIKAILPIVKIKSKLFSNRIISAPYQEYGGFVGDQNYFSKIIEHLKWENNTQKHKFKQLEINENINNSPKKNIENNTKLNQNFFKSNHYKRLSINFDPNLNKDQNTKIVWKNIQKSKRKAIKKAQKILFCKPLPSSDLNEFYKLYLENMRSFGSPPYSKKYFQNFQTLLQNKDLGQIFACYIKDDKNQTKLVSALLGFTCNKTVHITTAISNPNYANFRPSDLMHWQFISWAIENNFHKFDFGRTRLNSGQFEYKKKWGTTIEDLPTYFFQLSQKNSLNSSQPKQLDQNNPKMKLAIKLWKFLPLKITEILGMPLRKRLGI